MVELINVTGAILPTKENLTLVLKPLVMFIIGIVIYAVFIFKFYRFVAKKDIFKLDWQKHNRGEASLFTKLMGGVLYVLEYIVLFPVFTFFWFVVFAALLTFMVKQQAIQNILLISMAIIAAIRMTAYYNEDLSKDLAKMLPFALLGVFIVDLNFFSFSGSIVMLKKLFGLWDLMIYYLVFVVVLEIILRLFHGVIRLFVKEE